LHAVLRVEQGSHRIQKILVLVEVVLLSNQIKFELLANVLVLELLVGADVLHELLEHGVRVPNARLGFDHARFFLKLLLWLLLLLLLLLLGWS